MEGGGLSGLRRHMVIPQPGTRVWHVSATVGGGGGEEHACKVLRCSSPRTPRTTDTSEMVAEDGVERRGNLILLGY